MTHRNPVQTAALLTGAVFLLVGALGFVPGVTTDYSALSFAGASSAAALLGLFQVSVLHNAVHLLFGVAGVAMSRASETARTFLVGGGAVYLLLAVYGVLVDHDSSANFVPVNAADNLLHLALGVVMVAAGVVLGGRRPALDGR